MAARIASKTAARRHSARRHRQQKRSKAAAHRVKWRHRGNHAYNGGSGICYETSRKINGGGGWRKII